MKSHVVFSRSEGAANCDYAVECVNGIRVERVPPQVASRVVPPIGTGCVVMYWRSTLDSKLHSFTRAKSPSRMLGLACSSPGRIM